MFPFEILQNILKFCDGQTLKTALNVNPLWQSVVEYLTKETDIWEECCHKDIPKHELEQIKNKFYTSITNRKKWLMLYENWLHWSKSNFDIRFKLEQIGKIKRISCICVKFDYLIIGFENGVVKILDKDFVKIRTIRDVNWPVEAIYILGDKTLNEPINLLVRAAQRVFIYDFFDDSFTCDTFNNCFLFSYYGDYLCGVSGQGCINISKLISNPFEKRKTLQLIYHGRIYSDLVLYACGLGEKSCMILTKNKVYDIDYTNNVIGPIEAKTVLEFCSNEEYKSKVYIFNNEAIISLTKGAHNIPQKQLFELFIVNKSNNSKKMFIPWQTFKAFISCVYFYGKTLLIGLTNGFVYIYHVTDWKLFNISEFVYMENVSNFVPILSIDLVEVPGKRFFYISTNCTVYKLTGYSVV